MTVTNVGTTGAVRPGKACMLNGAAELVSVAALLAVLAWAVIRPRGWPEAVAAVPAAAVVVATGALPPGAALAEAQRLGPVLAFLAAGAAVLAARALGRRRVTAADLARATAVPFLLFVLALGIVVQAVVRNGLDRVLGPVIPSGTSLPALLGVAALAAALANLINNLPAVLALLPLVAPAGPAAVLAVLLGVNIGPNLTYTGSLATLLWRRVLHERGTGPALGEFTRLGLLTVPAGLTVAVLALWAALHVFGG